MILCNPLSQQALYSDPSFFSSRLPFLFKNRPLYFPTNQKNLIHLSSRTRILHMVGKQKKNICTPDDLLDIGEREVTISPRGQPQKWLCRPIPILHVTRELNQPSNLGHTLHYKHHHNCAEAFFSKLCINFGSSQQASYSQAKSFCTANPKQTHLSPASFH